MALRLLVHCNSRWCHFVQTKVLLLADVAHWAKKIKAEPAQLVRAETIQVEYYFALFCCYTDTESCGAMVAIFITTPSSLGAVLHFIFFASRHRLVSGG